MVFRSYGGTPIYYPSEFVIFHGETTGSGCSVVPLFLENPQEKHPWNLTWGHPGMGFFEDFHLNQFQIGWVKTYTFLNDETNIDEKVHSE